MNNRGFTLIEMMVVLMIISTLLAVTVPNITKNNSVVKDKGCEAFVKLVETQIQAYEIENNQTPASLQELLDNNYLETTTCPGGDVVTYENGVVSVSSSVVSP